MKRLSGLIKAVLVLLLLSTLLISNSCSQSKPEGFAIYLTTDNYSPAQMPQMNDLSIAKKAFISGNDIVSYNYETHEIQLTTGAYQRIKSLKIPVMGEAFVVCVDKKPIYWGSSRPRYRPISS